MRAGVRRGDNLNKHKNRLATGLIVASFSVPVLAEESETYELQPNLVVTPGRQPESIDRSFAAVSVLTREDIEISVVVHVGRGQSGGVVEVAVDLVPHPLARCDPNVDENCGDCQ